MPTLLGYTPGRQRRRELTVYVEAGDEPEWVRLWIHPPGAAPEKGWAIRVRRADLAALLHDFLEPPP